MSLLAVDLDAFVLVARAPFLAQRALAPPPPAPPLPPRTLPTQVAIGEADMAQTIVAPPPAETEEAGVNTTSWLDILTPSNNWFRV